MTTRRPNPRRVLQVESLENRLVLSTTSAGVHALAQAHPAPAHVASAHAHVAKVAAIPNPVLVNLSPDVTGIVVTDVSYDSRINLITVKGTIDTTPSATVPPNYYYPPTYPGTDYVTVAATQPVTQFRSVSGTQYSNLTVADSTVKSISFNEKILASQGKFIGGTVQLSISVSGYDYSYKMINVIAKLRNAKAY